MERFAPTGKPCKILSYGGYNPYNDAGYKNTVDIRSDSPEQKATMIQGGRYDLGSEVLGVTPPS